MYAGQIVELGPKDAMFEQPVAPLHAGAARLDPAPEPGPRPHRHPGPHAGARRPSGRLPLPRPLRVRRSTPARQSVPELRRRRAGPPGALHPRRTRSARWDISRGTVPDADPDKPRDVILVDRGPRASSTAASRSSTTSSFDLGKAEVVALVGESGSGKTTISRSRRRPAQGLDRHDRVRGHAARPRAPAQRSAADRKRIQYIFQNPYLSLNPRLTIEQIVKRPMELFGIAKGKEATDRVVDLLDQVALGPADAEVPGQPALRRRAAAGRDRPGPGRRARRAGLRRDHLGARRLGAGLDRRPARVAPAVARHQHAVRHPQPRAGALHRRPRARSCRPAASSRPVRSSR